MTLELTAKNDERMGLLGQTGMGKTYLVERLIETQPRVVAVDSKGHLNWKGYYLTDNPMGALQQDHVIYRPTGGAPPEDWWETVMHDLHERGGGIVYIDEMSYISDANRVPRGLATLFRLGRERGVGVWWCAQEATSVHNTTLRQAQQLVLFYNQGASDRDKLTRIVGDMGEVTSHLKEYQFVVFVRGTTYDHDAIPVFRCDAP